MSVFDTAKSAVVVLVGLLVAINLLILAIGMLRQKWHKGIPKVEAKDDDSVST